MFYPEEFKVRVKKAYPDFESLHQALDRGDEIVGRYLSDNRSSGLDFDTILNATSLEELQEKARDKQEKNELYYEWFVIYDELFDSDDEQFRI